MKRSAVVAAAILLAAAMMPAAIAAHHTDLAITISRAPVAPDGLTAGAQTDFVVTFVDRAPSVDGIALRAGATITIELPADFIPGPGVNAAIILQGWPQSPPAPPPLFPWTTDFDGTTVSMTLTQDWNPGDVGPGAKQVHLALLGWTNPSTGMYPVSLSIQPDPASDTTLTGSADVRIQRKDKPAVSAVALFSGGGPPPPFNNPLYQSVELGEDSLPVGLYLWNSLGQPFDNVELRKVSARSYRLFDGERTVGHIRVKSPRRARNHEVIALGDYAMVNAFLTLVPVGLLRIQLAPDDGYPGEYEVTIKMAGGNAETLRVTTGGGD